MLSGILQSALHCVCYFAALTLKPRAGYRITACAATPHQAAFVLSIPTRPVFDETQETLRTSAFPSSHVQVRALLLVACLVCSGARTRWPAVQVIGHVEVGFRVGVRASMAQGLPDGFAQHPGQEGSHCETRLQEKWAKDLYISCVAYGRTMV